MGPTPNTNIESYVHPAGGSTMLDIDGRSSEPWFLTSDLLDWSHLTKNM